MRNLIALAALLIVTAAAPLRALATCTRGPAPAYLPIPNFNDDGDVWGQCMNAAFAQISSTTVSTSSISGYFVTDNLLSQANGSQLAFPTTQAPSTTASLFVVLDGLIQAYGVDFTYSYPNITMTTAPASNSTSFFATYAVNTTTLTRISMIDVIGDATFESTATVRGNQFSVGGAKFTIDAGTVTAARYFGNGSSLVGIPSTASIAELYVPYTGATAGRNVALGNNSLTSNYGFSGATLTLTGQAFAGSFAGSTFSGIGTTAADVRTLTGDVTLSPGAIAALTLSNTTHNGTFAYGVGAGSFTATAGFFGDGSHLTGFPSTGSISGVYAPLAGATFTGASGITNAAFTATGAGGNIIGGSSITTTGALYGANMVLGGTGASTIAGSLTFNNTANTAGATIIMNSSTTSSAAQFRNNSSVGGSGQTVAVYGKHNTIDLINYDSDGNVASIFWADGSVLIGDPTATQQAAGYMVVAEPLHVKALLESSGTLRVSANAALTGLPASGKGLELRYRTDSSNDKAEIQAYDRTASAWKAMQVDGLTIALNANSAGSVGIGKTPATYTLDALVASGVRFSSSSTTDEGIIMAANGNTAIKTSGSGNRYLQFANSGTNTTFIGIESALAGGQTFGGSTAKATIFGTQDALPLQLFTNNALRMTVASGGGVGIGTSTPVTKLQVAFDTVYANDVGQIAASDATNPLKRLAIGFDGTANVGFIQSVFAGDSYKGLLLNPNGGFVGMGTTNPTTVLYSSGTAAVVATLDSSSTNGVELSFRNSSTLIGQVGSAKTVGGNLADEVVYAVSDLILSGTNIRMNTITGTQMYYCNGGVNIGMVCRGSGCACAGGTETALGIYLP